MKMLGFTARLVLSTILVFQLSFGAAFAAAGDGGSRSVVSYNSDSPYVQNFLRDYQKVELAADALESGELLKQDPKNFDIFNLKDQRVEIYKSGKIAATYSLNTRRIQKPVLSYTNLKPRYNLNTRELIFEATSGADSRGEGGAIVARHIIPNVDIAGLTHDKELVMFMDTKGNLHVIDMGYVISEVFTNAIPTFRNIWSPLKPLELKAGETELNMITRGTRPVASDANLDEALLPLNEKGEIEFTAGDLLVRIPEGNSEKVIGVFSRQVTYKRVQAGSAFISMLGAYVTPEVNVIEYMHSQKNTLESFAEAKAEAIVASSHLAAPLKSFDIKQLRALGNRIDSLTNYSQGRFDKFTQTEWNESYKAYKALVSDEEKIAYLKKRTYLMKDKAVGEEYKAIYREGFEDFLKDAESVKLLTEADGLEKGWQILEEPAPRLDPFSKKPQKELKDIPSERKAEFKYAGIILGIHAAYLGGALLYPQIEVFQQVKAFTWMYEHFYFDILKSFAYQHPASYAIMAWLAVWPATFMASFSMEKILNAAGKVYHNSNGPIANFVKDLHKTWAPITDWQRIISFGMRQYSHIVYPYLRAIIEGSLIGFVGLRQKAFFSAWDNGISPFRFVRKNSDLGKAAGATRSEFMGLNNPFLAGAGMADAVNRKAKLQSTLNEQKEKNNALALMLAVTVVAEKTGVDPATLMQNMQSGVLTPENIDALFETKESKRLWLLTTAKLIKDLKTMNALPYGTNITDLSKEELTDYYKYAKKVADKISSRPQWRQLAALRWKTYRKMPLQAADFILFKNGQEDALFLRSLITNTYVTKQVAQEFRTDHVLVSNVPVVIGARADENRPDLLAVSNDGLMWSTPPHIYDVGVNTINHFFIAGGVLSLVYQKVQAIQETLYLPVEDFKLTSEFREESFSRGLNNWLWFGYNQVPEEQKPESKLARIPHFVHHLATEAKIGDIVLKRLTKKFTTIQASFTLAVIFRLILGGQNLATASAAFAYLWVAGYWRYAWPWDPLQRGNEMMDQRIEKYDHEMKALRTELSQALKNSDMERATVALRRVTELYDKQNPKAVKLLKEVLQNNIPQATLVGDSEIKNYYGLISKLATELKRDSTSEEVTKTADLLRKVLVDKDGYDKAEVAKLNTQSLLEFSVANPPVPTHAKRVISEFFTLNGALWTTVLYIPVSVALFSPVDLAWSNILKWTLYAGGLYAGTWAALGSKPWEFYKKKYEQIKANLSLSQTRVAPKNDRTGQLFEEQLRIDEKLSRQVRQEKTAQESQSLVGKVCRRLFNK